MDVVTVSPRFQVVLPAHICEALGIEPGQKIQAVLGAGRVELIPLRPAWAMRGFLAGIDSSVPRERHRP